MFSTGHVQFFQPLAGLARKLLRPPPPLPRQQKRFWETDFFFSVVTKGTNKIALTSIPLSVLKIKISQL